VELEQRRTRRERVRYWRNVAFGVTNGALLQLGDTFIHPTLVLVVFVSQLTTSNLLVGLVPALSVGLWFLPQFLSAALVQGRRRQLPWAAWASVVRAAAVGGLGAATAAIGERDPSLLLTVFVLAYAVYNLAAGFAFVPLVELSARVIPADRRGLFFSQRNFWGGLLAFLAGFVINRALAVEDASLSATFGTLFFASFAALCLASYTTVQMSEVPDRRPTRRPPARYWIEQVPELLRRAPLQRFLAYRVLLALGTIADPFFVVYAQVVLGAPVAIAGLYLSAMAVARFASNVIWGRLVDHWGDRAALQTAALVRLLMPLLALGLPPLLRWDTVAAWVPGGETAIQVGYGLVFVAYGVALSGQTLTNLTYALELAGPDARPAFVGLVNTVLGVVSFVPILGGSVADRFGFEVLFLLALVLALLAVLASGWLPETRGVAGRSRLPSVWRRSRPR
jgi:MFS family permease